MTTMTGVTPVRARTGLSPEWDRGFDETFMDLVCNDDELVRAEFDALVGAVWHPPVPPAPPAPRAPAPPGSGPGGPGEAGDPGAGARERRPTGPPDADLENARPP